MSATAILSHKTFSLCGHGDPYHDCQDLLYFGCKNEHGYFNEAKGKAYVKVVRRNCGRLECPKCLDKVTTNKARKIQKRLKAWKVDRLTIKHIIVSPNPKETKYMLHLIRQKERILILMKLLSSASIKMVKFGIRLKMVS